MEWAYKAKAQEPDKQKMAFLGVLGTEVAALAVGVRTACFLLPSIFFAAHGQRNPPAQRPSQL